MKDDQNGDNLDLEIEEEQLINGGANIEDDKRMALFQGFFGGMMNAVQQNIDAGSMDIEKALNDIRDELKIEIDEKINGKIDQKQTKIIDKLQNFNDSFASLCNDIRNLEKRINSQDDNAVKSATVKDTDELSENLQKALKRLDELEDRTEKDNRINRITTISLLILLIFSIFLN